MGGRMVFGGGNVVDLDSDYLWYGMLLRKLP
jgi:hypothetical protein